MGLLFGDFVHEARNRIGLLKSMTHQIDQLITNTEGKRTNITAKDLHTLTLASQEIRLNLKELEELLFAYTFVARKQFEPVDVNQIIREIMVQLKSFAREHRTQVYVDLEPNMPHVNGVRYSIKHAIINLMLSSLQNFWDYDKRISLSAQKFLSDSLSLDGRLLVQTRYHVGGQVEIRLISSGPGIHHLNSERQFYPDFSLGSGIGLGLYTSHSIIKNMGGSIILQGSIMFVGSAIAIMLPAQKEQTHLVKGELEG
jgi:two-component system NtrC family sensor kinase